MTKKLLVCFAVAVLLALNVWKWWPANSFTESATLDEIATVSPDRLMLLMDPSLDPEPMQRNPFSFGVLSKQTPEVIEKPPAASEPDYAPPAIDAQNTDGFLAEIKLGGVVYREGQRYAYLLESGNGHLVKVGTIIFNHYKVKEITVRSVTLTDITSGAEAGLSLSGM